MSPEAGGEGGDGMGEPSGYFDPGYFPPMGGGNAVNEILKDRKKGDVRESSPSEVGIGDGERERRESSSTATSWYASDEEWRSLEGENGDGERGPERGGKEGEGGEGGGSWEDEQGHPHSRTHSMSGSKRPSLALFHRPDSDPVPTVGGAGGDSTVVDGDDTQDVVNSTSGSGSLGQEA